MYDLTLSTRFALGERVVVWSPSSPEWVLMEYPRRKPRTSGCRSTAFPQTGSGKIQKFILRDQFVAGEFTKL